MGGPSSEKDPHYHKPHIVFILFLDQRSHFFQETWAHYFFNLILDRFVFKFYLNVNASFCFGSMGRLLCSVEIKITDLNVKQFVLK